MIANTVYRFTLSAVDEPVTAEQYSEHVDRVMDELLALEEGDERISDSAVSLDAGRGTVEIELLVTVDGSDYEHAAAISSSVVRAAIHAAGGYTSNWGPEHGNHTGLVKFRIEELHTVPA